MVKNDFSKIFEHHHSTPHSMAVILSQKTKNRFFLAGTATGPEVVKTQSGPPRESSYIVGMFVLA